MVTLINTLTDGGPFKATQTLSVYAYREGFDTSMMVHFRKRFTPELLQRVNELMYERTHPNDSG